MLENNIFKSSLGISAYFSAINEDVATLYAGETERCPFAKPFIPGEMVNSMEGFPTDAAVEIDKERSQLKKCSLDAAGPWNKIGRADKGIGKFFGMIDDPAAGDPLYHLNTVSPAASEIDDLFRLLESPAGKCRRIPAVETQYRSRFARTETGKKRFINRHVFSS